MTHRYTHEAVHTWRVEARGRPRGAKKKSRRPGGEKKGKQSKVSVLYLAVWVGIWSKRRTRKNLSGSLLMLLLLSWLPLSSFFCCYFHILENMK